MKVLWLVSWYPTPLLPFDGDFIQRHARAVALHYDVEVIYVIKDEEGKITHGKRQDITVTGKLTERIIYYKPLATGIGFIDKYFSHRQYLRLYKRAVKQYISDNRKPSFIHVHVALKAGLVALWLKKMYNIPYILSEHWAWFLPEASPNMHDFGIVYKKWWRKIFAGADKITVVSKVLGEALTQQFGIKKYTVIPNVVDTALFYPVENKNNIVTTFVHISSLSFQKNPEHIIEAFAILKQKTISFLVDIFGPQRKELINLVMKKGLGENIHFHEEVPQTKLAATLRNADALILYSRFETFGCVLIEANAAGIPGIVSDIPVFHEIVEEGINGFFVQKEDPIALAEKLAIFILHKTNTGKLQIAATAASKYNYEKVGRQFIEIYHQY